MAGGSESSESDFLRLFVKHEQALRAFARVLLPSWQAIDEVMQEASVVMWKRLGQLESADDFLPWEKLSLEAGFAKDEAPKPTHYLDDVQVRLITQEVRR